MFSEQGQRVVTVCHHRAKGESFFLRQVAPPATKTNKAAPPATSHQVGEPPAKGNAAIFALKICIFQPVGMMHEGWL